MKKGLTGVKGVLCTLAILTLFVIALIASEPKRSFADSRHVLSFQQRVAYQQAIEEVYWRHRIWPKERPDPKPSLDSVMSLAKLEEKVADYLRKSQALDDYWQQPITAEQLQAEMDRIAQHTKQPEVLRELFEALGNDPFVVAECLARPALAERLLTKWYSYDQRIHGDLKHKAEAELKTHNSIEAMREINGIYSETEFIRSAGAQDVVDRGASHGVKLNSLDWEETVERLVEAFNHSNPVKALALGVRGDAVPFQGADMSAISKGAAAPEYKALPLGKLSSLREDEARYYVMAVIEKADSHLKLATIAWSKEPLHLWLAKAEAQVPVTMAAVSTDYTLPVISGQPDRSIPSGACTDDTWTPAGFTNVPDARAFPTSVWTGSEMVVWGGYPQLNTGGRYNPSTDSWTATSTINAPEGRELHTAVWTGSEMIVWGGDKGKGVYFNTGGKYNPSTDTWTATSIVNAPDRRSDHTAVWTGNEMIVWGGYNDDYLSSGGRYNPSTDSWTATRATGAPDSRRSHTAVWTGSEMIVWGGGEPVLNTGGRYNPISDSWTPTSTTNAPVGREIYTAVWTGSEMIVWGGIGNLKLNTGGRYHPDTDSWIATSTTNAPLGRELHTAVWTGSEMIIWGGYAAGDSNTGGKYNPSSDSWTATSITEAPDRRSRHTAVWTGSEMIVWGGLNSPTGFLNTGGRFVPSTNSWTATSTTSAPSGRYFHTAVWTGSEMIVWGGVNGFGGGNLNTGGRYNPSTDSWTATTIFGAPVAREFHTAVWTGNEMIVWGGEGQEGGLNTHWSYNANAPPTPTPTPTPVPYLNTGGRYNPSTDSWTATSTTTAPAGRYFHSAVWTGSEMVVWAGYANVTGITNTGGRYDPGADSWTATSTSNAPAGRSLHTAVWSGSEMIVWGGGSCVFGIGCPLNTGGRYHPSTDSWIAVSTTNAPAARFEHTAAWSGNEMIVWGGRNVSYENTGGKYNPITDVWLATSITGAPSARAGYTAVWTGRQMIVWGGGNGLTFFDAGGKYDPLVDSWMPTSITGAPGARFHHTAVWTGSEMIVWGGRDVNESFPTTGGRYCAQPSTPLVQNAVSRKTHGNAGSFGVNLPLTGTPGIECRNGGGTNDYTIVVTFLANVSVSGNPQAAVTSGLGIIGSSGVSNGGMVTTSENVVTIPLTNVANAQTITITLNNVNGSTNMTIPMSLLIGDTNGDGLVNSGDAQQTRNRANQATDATNFRSDVDADGFINSGDTVVVRGRSGTALP